MNARVLPLLLLMGCSSTAATTVSEPAPTQVGRATLVIRAVWKEDGRERLVGGLRCEVRRLEPRPLVGEQITEEGEPLVVEGIRPGTYTLTVAGKKRAYTTEAFVLAAGKKTTVRVDLVVAKAEADGTVLKRVGDGLFRLVTAPVRLTLSVIKASETPQAGEPPFDVEEKPSSRQ